MSPSGEGIASNGESLFGVVLGQVDPHAVSAVKLGHNASFAAQS